MGSKVMMGRSHWKSFWIAIQYIFSATYEYVDQETCQVTCAAHDGRDVSRYSRFRRRSIETFRRTVQNEIVRNEIIDYKGGSHTSPLSINHFVNLKLEFRMTLVPTVSTVFGYIHQGFCVQSRPQCRLYSLLLFTCHKFAHLVNRFLIHNEIVKHYCHGLYLHTYRNMELGFDFFN